MANPAHDPDRALDLFWLRLHQNQEQEDDWKSLVFCPLLGLKLLLAVPAATAHSRASA
jgi:hypothetical protein